jgi:quercetin dioxygenase-like cupin family protein
MKVGQSVYIPNAISYHKKVWGYEIWLANNELYCGKILGLKKGYRCSYHYHLKKDETFYVLKGLILLELNGKEHVMAAGSAIRVRPGDKHRFTGLERSEILEISTQHFEDDSYRLTKSERVTWFKKKILDRFKTLKDKEYED